MSLGKRGIFGMVELIAGALLLLLAIVVRRIATCPLFRTLAISAHCWAESDGVRTHSA